MKLSLLACVVVLAGCGGGAASTDAALPGLCGADVPSGQACNQVANLGEPVVPTCRPEPVPAGQGGTIAAGTYVLTEQVYYNRTTCTEVPISATLVIAGNCIQGVVGGTFAVTNSGTFVVAQPNGITLSQTCTSIGTDAAVTADAPGGTFTATASTFTLFTNNAAVGNPNPDRAAVFARR